MNTAQAIVSASFDIANISAPAARVTHNVDLVFDADGEPLAGFVIVGKNSEEYRAISHSLRAEGYKKSARRKTAIDASTDDGADQLVTIVDGNAQRTALAVVVDWYGFTSAGTPVPFDPALVKASFDKFSTWQDKVLAALEVDANFLKVLSPASLPTPSTTSSD